MRVYMLITALAVALGSDAQTRTPDHKPTAQGTMVLPTQLGNKVFDRLTSPLGELDLCVQFPLWKGFGLGIGGKAMGWELKKTTFTQLNTQGDAGRMTWYLKAQYAHYTSPITFYEINGKVGSSSWKWDCATCEEDIRQSGLHWSASGGYYVHATANLAFGITVGYEADAANFSPEVICLDEFPGYTERGGPYNFLTVGLGFSTRFEKAEEERW